MVGGENYQKVGDGGYALGARSQQIRDNLLAKTSFDEQALLAIQLDDKAVFLSPWQQLLLEKVLPTSTITHVDDAKDAIENWSGSASRDDLGYLLVRQFRFKTRQLVFSAMAETLKQADDQFRFNAIRNQLEAPLWQMVTEQPTHLLPPGYTSWQQLLDQAFSQSIAELNQQHTDWRTLTWGTFNQVQIRHPMSPFVPLLGYLTDMNIEPQSGDSYMPRVAGNSFGSSQRLVVAPGHEENGILHMPSSQSGHPLSPYFAIGNQDWLHGRPSPLLPGKIQYQLDFIPN